MDFSLKQAVVSKFDLYGINPRTKNDGIPAIVKLVENPASLLALPGKIGLFDHDCLHVILAEDTSLNGEAFLVGFCMGSDNETKKFHVTIFKFVSRFLYPAKYQFKPDHFVYFNAGFDYGRSLKRKSINKIDFARIESDSVDNIREYLGVDLYHVSKIKQEYVRQKCVDSYLKNGKRKKIFSTLIIKRKKHLLKTLKISASICAIGGGVMLASNSNLSPYGFLPLAAGSFQWLFASILERKWTLAFNFGSIFFFVDLLGIYRWLLN